MKLALAGIQLSLVRLFLVDWVGQNSPFPLVGTLLVVLGTVLVGYDLFSGE